MSDGKTSRQNKSSLLVDKLQLLVLLFILNCIIALSLSFWLVNVWSYPYLGDTWKPVSPWRWLFAICIPMLISKWGLKRGSLDFSGAVSGLLVGFLLTLGSLCFFSSLMAFFVLGSKATKFRSKAKKKIEEEFKEGGQRNWVQVFCNGGVATELSIIYMIENGIGEKVINFSTSYSASWYSMAVLGALACSCGDTFASEIGSVIGKSQPRLITTFQKVPRGTNGGVSLVGCVASLVGGLLVGLAYYITLVICTNEEQLQDAPPQWLIVLIGGAAGIVGSTVDSLLGATCQYSGYCPERNCIVERSGPGVEHISGFQLLDNHSVNLISSMLTCLLTPRIALAVWRYYT